MENSDRVIAPTLTLEIINRLKKSKVPIALSTHSDGKTDRKTLLVGPLSKKLAEVLSSQHSSSLKLLGLNDSKEPAARQLFRPEEVYLRISHDNSNVGQENMKLLESHLKGRK